jgi:uncharacterized cupin superfamily protein
MQVYNIGKINEDCVWRDRAGLVTQYLGRAAGSERLYVNIDHVPPGTYSSKYHSHSRQEEFFLILGGRGTLRLNRQEYPVFEGDFIAKPAGRDIAHTFFNSGDDTLVILDAGTAEREDTVFYPDEGVRLEKSGEERCVVGADEGWTSDPNEK